MTGRRKSDMNIEQQTVISLVGGGAVVFGILPLTWS
jgi:hypothetical protein